MEMLKMVLALSWPGVLFWLWWFGRAMAAWLKGDRPVQWWRNV